VASAGGAAASGHLGVHGPGAAPRDRRFRSRSSFGEHIFWDSPAGPECDIFSLARTAQELLPLRLPGHQELLSRMTDGARKTAHCGPAAHLLANHPLLCRGGLREAQLTWGTELAPQWQQPLSPQADRAQGRITAYTTGLLRMPGLSAHPGYTDLARHRGTSRGAGKPRPSASVPGLQGGPEVEAVVAGLCHHELPLALPVKCPRGRAYPWCCLRETPAPLWPWHLILVWFTVDVNACDVTF